MDVYSDFVALKKNLAEKIEKKIERLSLLQEILASEEEALFNLFQEKNYLNALQAERA